MKILLGKWKGKKICSPVCSGTRPTTSLVKQSIFNVIDVSDLIVLDLFCGSGAFCFEALSLGAKFCYMSDVSKGAVECVLKNASALNCLNDVKVMLGDARLSVNRIKKMKLKVDVIFLDPPYDNDFFVGDSSIMRSLIDVCKEETRIILESRNVIDLEGPFKLVWQRKYGNTYVTIFRISS